MEGGTDMKYLVIALVLVIATSAFGFEKKAYQIREDFGTEPLYDCLLNYYYYIPCPTYSWFWAFTGWVPGDIIGVFFELWDYTMSYSGCPDYVGCDPANCHVLEQIRILDFAGYGTVYPGLFTVEYDVYCCDDAGCPIGPSLWNSGPWENAYAWNYIGLPVDPPISICECATEPDPVFNPRILVTATHTGTDGIYPAWGCDNISTAIEQACMMHDTGCCPALYPRPWVSHYRTIHSGYYGPGFMYCPPQWFCDGRDTTPDCTMYGFVELAWRVYMICSGPTATEPSTWGNIKSMYR
jgi:hypothetical protein